MPRPTLSVCITSFNRGAFLPHLLDNAARVADELIVLDTESTDGSAELLAARPDVRLIRGRFEGHYGRLKNEVLDAATGDWILLLDSDELIGDRLARRLPALLRTRRLTHYKLPRAWLVPGLPLRHVVTDDLYPDHQLRLFRNDPFWRYPASAAVHEHFPREGRGKGRKLRRGHLLHFDFVLSDRASRQAKVDRYVTTGTASPLTSRVYLYEDLPHRLRRTRERVEDADLAAIMALSTEAGG